MAKSGNTWQKKLMAKAKRNWMRERLGTCTRLSPRGFNAGQQTGIVERVIERGKVVDADHDGVYTFKGKTFNKWRRYENATRV